MIKFQFLKPKYLFFQKCWPHSIIGLGVHTYILQYKDIANIANGDRSLGQAIEDKRENIFSYIYTYSYNHNDTYTRDGGGNGSI